MWEDFQPLRLVRGWKRERPSVPTCSQAVSLMLFDFLLLNGNRFKFIII